VPSLLKFFCYKLSYVTEITFVDDDSEEVIAVLAARSASLFYFFIFYVISPTTTKIFYQVYCYLPNFHFFFLGGGRKPGYSCA